MFIIWLLGFGKCFILKSCYIVVFIWDEVFGIGEGLLVRDLGFWNIKSYLYDRD